MCKLGFAALRIFVLTYQHIQAIANHSNNVSCPVYRRHTYNLGKR